MPRFTSFVFVAAALAPLCYNEVSANKIKPLNAITDHSDDSDTFQAIKRLGNGNVSRTQIASTKQPAEDMLSSVTSDPPEESAVTALVTATEIEPLNAITDHSDDGHKFQAIKRLGNGNVSGTQIASTKQPAEDMLSSVTSDPPEESAVTAFVAATEIEPLNAITDHSDDRDKFQAIKRLGNGNVSGAQQPAEDMLSPVTSNPPIEDAVIAFAAAAEIEPLNAITDHSEDSTFQARGRNGPGADKVSLTLNSEQQSYFQLKSKRTDVDNICIGVYEDGQVLAKECSGTDEQKFRFQDGKLQPKLHQSMCVGPKEDRTHTGTKVELASCSNKVDLRLNCNEDGKEYCSIELAETNLCVEMEKFLFDEIGAKVKTCIPTLRQQWQIS